MIEDMQLKGLALRTQEAYINAVFQLSKHLKKSPDQINEEELREYFLYLKNKKRVAESTFSIALCGIKFFYEHTLEKNGIPCNLLGLTEKRNCRLFSAWTR